MHGVRRHMDAVDEKIGEGLIRYVDTTSYMSGCSFRIAPRTILVNGVEVPAPEEDAPADGTEYFMPSLTGDDQYESMWWDGGAVDRQWLERGLVYLDKDSAIARAKAMLITQEVK